MQKLMSLIVVKYSKISNVLRNTTSSLLVAVMDGGSKINIFIINNTLVIILIFWI